MKKLFLISMLALTGCMHMSQQECMTTDWHSVGLGDGKAGQPPRDLLRAVQDCSKYQIGVDQQGYAVGFRQGAKIFCTPDFNQGVQAGRAGTPSFDIMQRQGFCNQAGVALNVKKYEAGRHTGLRDYCTYDNGMNIARQGQAMPSVCADTGQGKNSFAAGWNAGQQQYCSFPETAFAIGKANQAYPNACPPQQFPAFRSEYERGALIGQRMQQLQERVNKLNDEISWLKRKEHDDDKSPDARERREKMHRLVREREDAERELFSLQVMR